MNQQAAPYVLAPGQARSHPGTFPTIKAGAADTGGLLTMSAGVIGPRTPGPPLHIHQDADECFYVVEAACWSRWARSGMTWARAASRGRPGRSRTPSPMSPPARCVCSG